MALRTWGDKWMAPEGGPSFEIHHRDCGGDIEAKIECAESRVPAVNQPGAAALMARVARALRDHLRF